MSKNQLNQSLSRVIWARSVEAAQALFILDANYFTLNEGWLRFEPVNSYHAGF